MTIESNSEERQFESTQLEKSRLEKSAGENPEVSMRKTLEAESSSSAPGFGWTRYAEQINGRFAMIGFIALLITEFITGQDFFTWIGLR